MKPLDLTKPVQTRSGLSVRIGFSDLQDDFPIVAAVKCKNGKEVVLCYRLDGTGYSPNKDLDLINVPEKKTGWINIYPHGLGGIYTTKDAADAADKSTATNRLACIQVTYTEGEGL